MRDRDESLEVFRKHYAIAKVRREFMCHLLEYTEDQMAQTKSEHERAYHQSTIEFIRKEMPKAERDYALLTAIVEAVSLLEEIEADRKADDNKEEAAE